MKAYRWILALPLVLALSGAAAFAYGGVTEDSPTALGPVVVSEMPIPDDHETPCDGKPVDFSATWRTEFSTHSCQVTDASGSTPEGDATTPDPTVVVDSTLSVPDDYETPCDGKPVGFSTTWKTEHGTGSCQVTE